MIQIFIYLVISLILAYYLLTKNYDYFEKKGIPYDKPYLFFGSFYNVISSKQNMLDRIRDLYMESKKHPYYGLFMFNKPQVLINSPELLKQIMVKDFDKFSDRPIALDEKIDPISYNALFISRGKNWKSSRIKISPVFTSGKMKLMMPLMKECSETFVEVLKNNGGKEVDVRLLTKKYAIDIISSCAFGINSYCLKDEKSEFLAVATQLLDMNSLKRNFILFCYFFIPSLVSLFRLKFVDAEASDWLVRAFTNTLAAREKNKIVRNDLIDLLNNLKNNEDIEDDYIFDDTKMAAQAIQFFGAGNETTSMTITYALYELALNSIVQNRLRDELKETFAANNGFTYEGLNQMKYLGMVVNETLRKYPLTIFLNRITVADYAMNDGKIINKGTFILIPVAGLHFDPEYFADPEKFDPERFSDENKAKILPYTYLPFGEGPRNCIGQRFGLLATKIALAYLIKDFIFGVSNKTQIPLVFNPQALLLNTKGGIYLTVSKV